MDHYLKLFGEHPVMFCLSIVGLLAIGATVALVVYFRWCMSFFEGG